MVKLKFSTRYYQSKLVLFNDYYNAWFIVFFSGLVKRWAGFQEHPNLIVVLLCDLTPEAITKVWNCPWYAIRVDPSLSDFIFSIFQCWPKPILYLTVSYFLSAHVQSFLKWWSSLTLYLYGRGKLFRAFKTSLSHFNFTSLVPDLKNIQQTIVKDPSEMFHKYEV